MTKASQIKITLAMSRELTSLLAEKGSDRFRRSDLSARVYILTTPRSRPRADVIADALIKKAASEGVIVRTGHQHWVKTASVRKLKSGGVIAESSQPVELLLNTRCPGKWLSVDLETGDIWHGSLAGWKRASLKMIEELRALLSV